MTRFDRLFGILLHLRRGRTISASDLAQQFEVSSRTIYRDVDTLSVLGVPVYAERGREGGFRLLDGYFLPPIMFSRAEAISLVLALTLFRSLHVRPFDAELVSAEARLLAAVPESIRAVLAEAQTWIGFEQLPVDVFHAEVEESDSPPPLDRTVDDSAITTLFLSGILEERAVRMRYRSLGREQPQAYDVAPLGAFWDRGFWYLVGYKLGDPPVPASVRLWRTDRVQEMALAQDITRMSGFTIQSVLDRGWLASAMQVWIKSAPVRILLTSEQAAQLERDWYYRHAAYDLREDGRVEMRFGEDNPAYVLPLVRWLGVGAELIEPLQWREQIQNELAVMLATYQAAGSQ